MSTAIQDFRYALRMLRKSPTFTAVAVLILALGIGSSVTIFSVVNAIILQPLRYGDPERLVTVWSQLVKGGTTNPSPRYYLEWQRESKTFDQLAATARASLDMAGDPPIGLEAAKVTPNFFDAVGVRPALGRTFTGQEIQSGSDHLAILSHQLWRNHFGSDPRIIGQTIKLNSEPWTVIGVMPADFAFFRGGHDAWIPLVFKPEAMDQHYLLLVGHLKSGETSERAKAELDAISAKVSEQFPESGKNWGNRIIPLRDLLLSASARRMVLILFGAVGLLLLIACANMANLLFARGAGRQKEIAVRLSLGARRSRIVQQLLTESVLLALAGSVAGLWLATFAVNYFRQLAILQIPGIPAVRIDSAVLLFVAGTGIFTTAVFGVAPAWQISQVNLLESIKIAGSNMIGGQRQIRLRNVLVAGELVLSLVLLATSGLLVRSFLRAAHTNPGGEPKGLLTMSVVLPAQRYNTDQAVQNFYDQVLARLRAIPGVKSADTATTLPLNGWLFGTPFRRPGQPASDWQSSGQIANTQCISEGYFQTLGLPVVRGRAFQSTDTASSKPVVIVNEKLVKRYLRNEDPIGKQLLIRAAPVSKRVITGSPAETAWEIVGIVPDVKDSDLEEPSSLDLYFPSSQIAVHSTYLLLRTDGDPAALTSAARQVIASLDKDLPVSDIATMEQRVSESLAGRRFATNLLGSFSTIALILAAAGVYGLFSYSVAQRTKEIGLRMVLGAKRSVILGMVLRSAVVLVGIGIAIGLVAALACARLMTSVLFEVKPGDPVALVGAAVILSAVGMLASYIPAWRATRVDPMVALRYE
ncbi:MAG TPA: ABC transporter permease [Candidatus Angelobacter sp.]